MILTQADFEEKYQETIRLATSFKEKNEIIKFQHREIDCFKEWKKENLDKEEVREQCFRKMNIWLYGLDQHTNENTWEASVLMSLVWTEPI